MPRHSHQDDVQVMLSFDKDAAGDVVAVHLDAAYADNGDDLFRLSLTPRQYARLSASGVTVARSTVRVARPGNEPECDETLSDRGDHDGRVREYTVTGTVAAGRSTGESVMLCGGHARFHGRNVTRLSAVGGRS